MIDPINLNRARKARREQEKKIKAEENRVRFGRTSAEKRRDEAESSRKERALDGKKRS